MNKDIATFKKTTEILEKHNLRAKKVLGQNFLIDNNIVKNIVAAAGISKESVVIEVGPGIGALTQHLGRAAKRVFSFEVDRRLEGVLKEVLADETNVEVVFEDFLRVKISDFLHSKGLENEEIYVVANLPYYITTPIILKILEEKIKVKRITVMVQQEVARRICGKVNSKEYNSLTIYLNYFCNTSKAFDVPRNVFMPRPNVDSSVINLDVVDKGYIVENEQLLFDIIRKAFAQRRKTLANNWSTLPIFGDDISQNKEYIRSVLKNFGYSESIRGEGLLIEDYIKISNFIHKNMLMK